MRVGRKPSPLDREAAIRMAQAGANESEIARALRVHRSSVCRWLANYRDNGMSAVHPGRTGRPPRKTLTPHDKSFVDTKAFRAFERARDNRDSLMGPVEQVRVAKQSRVILKSMSLVQKVYQELAPIALKEGAVAIFGPFHSVSGGSHAAMTISVIGRVCCKVMAVGHQGSKPSLVVEVSSLSAIHGRQVVTQGFPDTDHEQAAIWVAKIIESGLAHQDFEIPAVK